MLFGMMKNLGTSKMIKEFIFASLSYLNFPPKQLTGVFLAKACFFFFSSFQSNEKHFLPFEPRASFLVYFLVQTLLPSKAPGSYSASVLQFFLQCKVRIIASLIAPSQQCGKN